MMLQKTQQKKTKIKQQKNSRVPGGWERHDAHVKLLYISFRNISPERICYITIN